jgi:hypothetical protein
MSKATFYRITVRIPKTDAPRSRVTAATETRIALNQVTRFRRSRPLSLRRIALARIRASK